MYIHIMHIRPVTVNYIVMDFGKKCNMMNCITCSSLPLTYPFFQLKSTVLSLFI